MKDMKRTLRDAGKSVRDAAEHAEDKLHELKGNIQGRIDQAEADHDYDPNDEVI